MGSDLLTVVGQMTGSKELIRMSRNMEVNSCLLYTSTTDKTYFNENEAGFTTGFKKEENPYVTLPVYRKKIGYGTSLES